METMSKKNQRNGFNNAVTTNNEHYSFYWSPETVSAIRIIANRFKKRVYLIGIRALYEQGVPIYRGTEDVDLYSPITIEERNELGKLLRKEYVNTSEYWRSFGTAFIFPSGYELDINRAVELYDETWDKKSIKIDHTDIFIPPLEDILVMKIMAGRPKDLKDIKHVLRTVWDHIDKDRLLTKAAKVGVEKKLIGITKKTGFRFS
jgi:hypothetical protein